MGECREVLLHKWRHQERGRIPVPHSRGGREGENVSETPLTIMSQMGRLIDKNAKLLEPAVNMIASKLHSTSAGNMATLLNYGLSITE